MWIFDSASFIWTIFPITFSWICFSLCNRQLTGDMFLFHFPFSFVCFVENSLPLLRTATVYYLVSVFWAFQQGRSDINLSFYSSVFYLISFSTAIILWSLFLFKVCQDGHSGYGGGKESTKRLHNLSAAFT